MLLLEHHGKALLRKHGIPTPRGVVVGDASALVEALPGLPERLVLKAQIAGGGRSKGGGIAFATGRKAPTDAFDSLRGSTVNGQTVDAVLVEEQIAFAQVATNTIRTVMSPLDRLTPLRDGRDEPPA